MERLRNFTVGPLKLDLAFVRAQEPYADRDTDAIVDVLNPGGAIVITGPADSFEKVWKPLRNRLPGLTSFDFGEGNSGVLVKAMLAS